jgi:hypothetical protein
MLTLIIASLAFQQTSVSIQVDSKKGAVVKVVASEGRDSSVNTKRKPIVATPGQLADAFVDASARVLLAKARDARTGQDSSIRFYDASTVQRLTLNMAFTKYGRDRIFFRHESSAHVRWARGTGAQIDITGKRSVVSIGRLDHLPASRRHQHPTARARRASETPELARGHRLALVRFAQRPTRARGVPSVGTDRDTG